MSAGGAPQSAVYCYDVQAPRTGVQIARQARKGGPCAALRWHLPSSGRRWGLRSARRPSAGHAPAPKAQPNGTKVFPVTV